jgi:hypothetical protein
VCVYTGWACRLCIMQALRIVHSSIGCRLQLGTLLLLYRHQAQLCCLHSKCSAAAVLLVFPQANVGELLVQLAGFCRAVDFGQNTSPVLPTTLRTLVCA